MDYKNLDELKTLDNIGLYRDELQKELQVVNNNIQVIKAERYNKALEILKLKREIKDKEIEKNILDQNLDKAQAVKTRLVIECERAKDKFWSLKNI